MMFGYGFGNTFGYFGWLGMFLMMLVPLAVIVGIIYLVYKALDKGTDRVRLGGKVQDPLNILKALTQREKYLKRSLNRFEKI